MRAVRRRLARGGCAVELPTPNPYDNSFPTGGGAMLQGNTQSRDDTARRAYGVLATSLNEALVEMRQALERHAASCADDAQVVEIRAADVELGANRCVVVDDHAGIAHHDVARLRAHVAELRVAARAARVR